VSEKKKLVQASAQRTPLAPQEFRACQEAMEKRLGQALVRDFVEPAFNKLDHGVSLASLSRFKKVMVSMSDLSIEGYLPNTFANSNVTAVLAFWSS
jgi:hypothetical protein